MDISEPISEIIIRQDAFGWWYCRFGDEEFPHFLDVPGFPYFVAILGRPFGAISCGELEGRFIPQSQRSIISQQEDAEVRHNEEQRRPSTDDASGEVIDKLGLKQVDKLIDRLIDNIQHEQQKKEPVEKLIADWQWELNKLQTQHGKLVNRKGRPRVIVAGDPYWQQIKRVERQLGLCREAIAKKMPLFAEYLKEHVHRQGEYYIYTPPRQADGSN